MSRSGKPRPSLAIVADTAVDGGRIDDPIDLFCAKYHEPFKAINDSYKQLHSLVASNRAHWFITDPEGLFVIHKGRSNVNPHHTGPLTRYTDLMVKTKEFVKPLRFHDRMAVEKMPERLHDYATVLHRIVTFAHRTNISERTLNEYRPLFDEANADLIAKVEAELPILNAALADLTDARNRALLNDDAHQQQAKKKPFVMPPATDEDDPSTEKKARSHREKIRPPQSSGAYDLNRPSFPRRGR